MSKIKSENLIISIICIAIILFTLGVANGKIVLNKNGLNNEDLQAETNLNTNNNNNSDNYNYANNDIFNYNIQFDNNYPISPLNISLNSRCKSLYNNLACTNINSYQKLVCYIALQITSANCINYERTYHFYSLDYTNACNKQNKIYYSLTSAINIINSGGNIYTDCFGFVRLVYSLACYQLNPNNPQTVNGFNYLYGYSGGYGAFNKINNLMPSTIIADRITGSGGSLDRHVAIVLCVNNNSFIFVDQQGVYTATLNNNYYTSYNNYKFSHSLNLI